MIRVRSLLVPVLFVLAGLFSASFSVQASSAQAPLLLRNPSLSQDKIAFRYADDIWTVARQGGEAERLTSNGQVNAGPIFSPDGVWIAYSARLRGNTDAYVIPSAGGVPRRITWHPDGSSVVGWSPDGKDILITSGAASYRHFLKLFRVHADGSGVPDPLPLPSGFQGSFSPDGQSIAYQPLTKWQPAWKRYVGGQTTPIWIVNLKTLDLVRVPRENSNDSNPIWVGNSVYFLSDRESSGKNAGPVSLFRYDTASKEVTPVVPNTGYDLKSFQSGPGGLVYEQFGSIHLVDTASNADKAVSIQIHGELANLLPHLASVPAEEIQNANLSPTGARAVFEAHGEIFTVPGEKGDTRNLTQTPGVAERNPAWSPDGKTIAYFSDASGEYQLYLHDQTGFKPPTVIDLGPDPSYFYGPTWSPDSKHIAYFDKHLRLWTVDVPAGKPVLVDKLIYGSFGPDFGPAWSPDSKWLAYHRDLDNQLDAIFLYSLETHKSTQVTDGMSDASSPSFDPNGKYLYFLASTDDGPSKAGIDLSSLDRAQTTAAYVVVLAKDGASPVPPESDDEKIKDAEKDKKDADKKEAEKKDEAKKDEAAKSGDKDPGKDEKKPVEVKVDLEKIGDRILSLPIPARNYGGIAAGKTGVLYLGETAPFGRPSNEGGGPGIRAIWRFTLEKRQPETVLGNLDAFNISYDGSKVLYARKGVWTIASVDDLKPGTDSPGKALNLGGMETVIDPRAEWKQIYHETWRIERDFLYDPHTHGLSIPKIEAKYKPYLDGLASRSEFTYLSTEMLGEITIGHMFVGGPHIPDNGPKAGLLGADLKTTATASPKSSAARTGPPAWPRPSPSPASTSTRAITCWPSTAANSTPPTISMSSSMAPPAGRPFSASAPTLTAPPLRTRPPATSPSFPSATRTVCAISTGSKATAARSQNSPAARSLTSTCPTPAAPATPTSTAISTPSSTNRRWSSTSATTRAVSSPITSSIPSSASRFPEPSSATASPSTTPSAPSSGPRSCSSTRTPAPAATPCPGTSARPASASWSAPKPGAAWSASAAIPASSTAAT
jgi:tricorn protease